jgi:hypothetical protein
MRPNTSGAILLCQAHGHEGETPRVLNLGVAVKKYLQHFIKHLRISRNLDWNPNLPLEAWCQQRQE